MAYGYRAPKQWFRCPSEDCKEPLHENEYCLKCGLESIEMGQLDNNSIVSEVRIKFINQQAGLIGFASVVINGFLKLNSIGIHEKLSGDGYRLTYPQKGDKTVFFPIKRSLSDAIEKAIFNELSNLTCQDNNL